MHLVTMATLMSLVAHVVPATAMRKVPLVENVTQLLANVTASQASQGEHVISVHRDTQSLTVSADVRV